MNNISEQLEKQFNLCGKTVKDPDPSISIGLMFHAKYMIEEYQRGRGGVISHANKELKALQGQEPVPENATDKYNLIREIRSNLANMALKYASPVN